MQNLTEATAFITGGAQGIGLGIARALAGRGVKLALVDIDQGALAAAKAELSPVTPTETYVLDVRDREAFAAIADTAESVLGPVTLLFNNAGVASGVAPKHMTYEKWDWMLGINIGGVVNGIQTFVPRMIRAGAGGYIVNTASGAGLVVAGSGYLYTTSKFAVVGMSESLHLELAPFGIGVSVLCPGAVATGIMRNTVSQQADGAELPPRIAEHLAETEAFLAMGTSIDTVGQMVLEAMDAGRLHIQTDDMLREAISARAGALIDSLPGSLAALPGEVTV